MDNRLLKEMYEMEKDYWWHKGKRANVLSLIKKFGDTKYSTILDVGCGTGYLLKDLQKLYKAYGVDTSKVSLAFCRKRGLKNLKAWDIEKGSYPGKTFDMILALDVVEHIKDDTQAMKNIAKSLQRNGIIIFTAPAFPFLWSYWDKLTGHYRRYDKKSLIKLFKDSGFEIEFINYTNVLIFLPVIIIRAIKQKLGIKDASNTSDFIKFPPLINNILYFVLRVEALVSRYIAFPFGLSFIVVARKAKQI